MNNDMLLVQGLNQKAGIFSLITITLAGRYKIVIYKGESFLIAGTVSTLFLGISNLALEIEKEFY